MHKNQLRATNKFATSFVISLGLHVLLFGLLLVTVNNTSSQPSIKVNLHPNPADKTIVHAKMIDKRAADQALKRQQQLLAEQRRAEELQREKELAQQQAVEQAKQKKLDMELAAKKAAEEKAQIALTQKKLQKEFAAKKKLQDQQMQKQQVEQKKAQDKLAQQKQEQQRVDELNKQQLARQKAQEQQIAGIKAQQERLVTAEHNAFLATEVERYTAAFQTAIEENRILSSVFTGDIRCKLRIKLLPDGSILSVSLVESSGNQAYDEMSQAAVYKTAPFPMPDDHELYSRLRDVVLSFKNGEQAGDVS